MPPAATDDGGGLWDLAASQLHSFLSSTIPAPLFTILAGFSNLAYRLVLGVSNDPSSWTSTLLPPFIALVLAYISLVMAYRTVRSTILVAWWGIKWGAIIGAAIAVWAWWVGEADAVTSTGDAPARFGWLSGASSLAGSLPLATTLLSMLSSPNTGSRSSGSSYRRSTPAGGRGRRSTTVSDSDPMEAIYAAARAAASGSDSPSRSGGRSSSVGSAQDGRPPLEELLQTLGVSPTLVSSLTGISGAGNLLSADRLQEWYQAARQGGNAWLGQTWEDLLAAGQTGGAASADTVGAGAGPAYNTRSRGGLRGQQQSSRRARNGNGVRPGDREDEQLAQMLSTAGRTGQALLRRLFP